MKSRLSIHLLPTRQGSIWEKKLSIPRRLGFRVLGSSSSRKRLDLKLILGETCAHVENRGVVQHRGRSGGLERVHDLLIRHHGLLRTGAGDGGCNG